MKTIAQQAEKIAKEASDKGIETRPISEIEIILKIEAVRFAISCLAENREKHYESQEYALADECQRKIEVLMEVDVEINNLLPSNPLMDALFGDLQCQSANA